MSQSPNPYTDKPYSAAYHVVHRQTRELPVSQRMPQLLETIQNNSVTILVGETGSGKSTQLAKYILESMYSAFNGDICLTQPRKLAAESVSLMITITSSNDIH
jgi:HrpA-like RNA helicase